MIPGFPLDLNRLHVDYGTAYPINRERLQRFVSSSWPVVINVDCRVAIRLICWSRHNAHEVSRLGYPGDAAISEYHRQMIWISRRLHDLRHVIFPPFILFCHFLVHKTDFVEMELQTDEILFVFLLLVFGLLCWSCLQLEYCRRIFVCSHAAVAFWIASFSMSVAFTFHNK